jgi:hypothetical protein
MTRFGSRRGRRLGSALGIGALLALGMGADTVHARPPTTQTSATSLTSSRNPATSVRTTTLTATVIPTGPTLVQAATGTVQFKDGPADLGPPVALTTVPLSTNGTASLTRSLTSAGTHALTAVYSGDLVTAGSTSAPLSQVVTVGPAASIIVSLQSPTMIANGNSTQIATATVTDTNGNPRSGDTVNFRSTGPGGDVTFTNPATGDSSGHYTVLVKSGTVVDLEHILATDSTPDNQVQFFSGGDGSAVAQWVDSNAPPDDTDGMAMRLSTPPGGNWSGAELLGVPAAPPATPPSFWYKSANAASPGGSPRFNIDFHGEDNVDSSIVTSPPNAPPLVADAWTLVDGAGQTWNSLGDSRGCGTPGTDARTYAEMLACHANFHDIVTGAYSVNDTPGVDVNIDDISYGTDNLSSVTRPGSGLLTSAAVILNETVGPASVVTVTPDPTTMPTDGTSLKTFTVNVSDATGNPVAGDTVVFSGSGDITFPVASPVTDANGNTTGVARAGTTVELNPEIVTATDTTRDVTGTGRVTEVSGPAHRIVVTTDRSSMPDDGVSTAQVTALVEDVNGNPVLHAGDALLFATTKGTFTPTTVMTDSHGVAVDNLTASILAGADDITVTDVTVPAVTAGTATVSETLRTTTTALTAAPNPSIPGQTVVLTATVVPAGATGTVTFKDGSTTLVGVGLNPAPVLSGTATLSSSVLPVGTHSLTAVYSGSGTFGTSTSSAVSQLVSPMVTMVVVTPHSHTLSANGVSHTTITAVLSDSNGPVSGDIVTFTSSPVSSPATAVTFAPATYQSSGSATGPDGTATAVMTSTTHAGTVTVTATEAGGHLGTAAARLKSSHFRSVTLAHPSIVANGTSQTSADAIAVDDSDTPVAGETVTFVNNTANGATVTPSVVTDANGLASAMIKSSQNAGANTITASSNNADPLADSAAAGTFTQSATLTQTVATTNMSFVHAAYNTMLGHQDPAGEAYWTDQLDNRGVSRSIFAMTLASSPEYRHNVIGGSAGIADFYMLYLDRAGDTAGINYWVGRMAGIGGSQLTFEQVRLNFAGSPEYFSSLAVGAGDRATAIEALYLDLLNRPSDTAGMNYWMANFNATTIAAQFLYSAEGRSFLVNTLYSSILHRAADGIGQPFWMNALLGGASDENIIANILASDEYFLSH